MNANPNDICTKHLVDLCELYQYKQLIQESTRVTSTSSTLIELFLTNESSYFTVSGVSHIGITDHSLIYTTRKYSTSKSYPRMIKNRQYKYFYLEDF